MVPVIWAIVSEQYQITHFILILPWEFLLPSLPVMAQHTCGPAILVSHTRAAGETISIKLWHKAKKINYYWITFKLLAYIPTWLRITGYKNFKDWKKMNNSKSQNLSQRESDGNLERNLICAKKNVLWIRCITCRGHQCVDLIRQTFWTALVPCSSCLS